MPIAIRQSSGRPHSSQSGRTLVIVLSLLPAIAFGACTQPTVQTGIRSGSSFHPVQPATPTPDPDRAAAAAALAAFDALIKHTDLTYHVAETDRIEIGRSGASATPTVFTVTGTADVAGADFTAVITARGITAQLRAVRGKFWTKDGSKAWVHQLDRAMPFPSEAVSPWQYLGDLSKLKFVARPDDRPEALEFANTGIIGIPTTATETLGIVGMITKLSFVLLEDGTPVEIRFDAEAVNAEGAKTLTLGTVTVSNVGGAIVIKSPV